MKSSARQYKNFTYGSFRCTCELVRQRRKTFSLTVQPDTSIILRLPVNAPDEKIEIFLMKKWLWLQKQLRYFNKYKYKHYRREYISGESLYYLGKQYQLIIKTARTPTIDLQRSNLLLRTVMPWDRIHKKRLIDQWFAHQAESVFAGRLLEMNKRFSYTEIPKLVILPMSRRWGSFTGKSKIILNPKLIHLPKECIDYVIVHELCHFQIKNHGKSFYTLLDAKYPRWEKVKERLENMGALIH